MQITLSIYLECHCFCPNPVLINLDWRFKKLIYQLFSFLKIELRPSKKFKKKRKKINKIANIKEKNPKNQSQSPRLIKQTSWKVFLLEIEIENLNLKMTTIKLYFTIRSKMLLF